MAVTVAFSSGKGGTGKTTTIETVCTYLHYATDYRVVLLDADLRQLSACEDRENELYQLEQMGEKVKIKQFYKVFEKESRPIYPILRLVPNQIKETLQALEETTDIIFIDTPGSIDSEVLSLFLPYTDFVFIPVHPDGKTIPQTVTFARVLENIMKTPGIQIQDVRFFYSKYTKTKLRDAFDIGRQYVEENTAFKFMKNEFYDNTDLVRGNLSTLVPLKGSESPDHFITKFIEELIEIITQ